MKELSTQYEIVELSKYTTPIIKEAVSREWIEYGVDNNYFQYLIDRYTGSTTNNAIINGMSRMIYGKGIDALDSRRKPDQYAQMLSIFKKDDLRHFITDRKMLGMSAWQITYKGKKVSFMEELQSDWAKEGREKGFQDKAPEGGHPRRYDYGYRYDAGESLRGL